MAFEEESLKTYFKFFLFENNVTYKKNYWLTVNQLNVDWKKKWFKAISTAKLIKIPNFLILFVFNFFRFYAAISQGLF